MVVSHDYKSFLNTGAGKIVASLRDGQYVTVQPSTADAREKIVTVTDRAHDYLAAKRQARQTIERDLRLRLGAEKLDALYSLLDELCPDDHKARDYLRSARQRILDLDD